MTERTHTADEQVVAKDILVEMAGLIERAATQLDRLSDIVKKQGELHLKLMDRVAKLEDRVLRNSP